MISCATSSFSSTEIRSKFSISFRFFVGMRNICDNWPVMLELEVVFWVRLNFVPVVILATKTIVVIFGETGWRNRRRWLGEFWWWFERSGPAGGWIFSCRGAGSLSVWSRRRRRWIFRAPLTCWPRGLPPFGGGRVLCCSLMDLALVESLTITKSCSARHGHPT
jgi:hypothetical protein